MRWKRNLATNTEAALSASTFAALEDLRMLIAAEELLTVRGLK